MIVAHDMSTESNELGKANDLTREVIVPLELSDGARIPHYAHPTDAGMDVYAMEDIIIKPGETKIIPLGFKVALPVGTEMQVRDRSGLASKTRLRVANAPGTVDCSYRDTVGVIIENTSIDIGFISEKLGCTTAVEEPKIYPIDKDDPDFVKNANGSYIIKKGERFAQVVVTSVSTAKFVIVDDVSKIGQNRGGGYGHSGVRR